MRLRRHESINPYSKTSLSWCERIHVLKVAFMNRRSFLRTSAVGSVFAGSAQTLRALAADNTYRANIGIQLYTMRDAIKEDPSVAIKAIVDAGYQQGELYRFPNCDHLIKACREHGLAMNSSHFEWETAVNPSDEGFSDFKEIVEKAEKTGLSHLVVPHLKTQYRESLDAYKMAAQNLNKAAMIAKEAGIQLAYHNHSFEYLPMEGSSGFEVFEKEFAPEMKFELDVFWVKVAGRDPVEQIEKLSGRVAQLHLKDLKEGLTLPNYGKVEKDAFKELGNGVISMEPIIKAAKEAGVAHCHVEQDQSPDPLASIKESMAYLKAL